MNKQKLLEMYIKCYENGDLTEKGKGKLIKMLLEERSTKEYIKGYKAGLLYSYEWFKDYPNIFLLLRPLYKKIIITFKNHIKK